VEGWLLTPRFLGGAVGLHPVIVMLAIMVGGELFGFSGIILAVPFTAAASVFWREALARFRRSELYVAGPAPPSNDAR
jgi:predicted PurR-regulated permease PerM